ncbi:ROK family protein [Herbiconiux sp. SYSU D00978]|uniref:ROK family protein n=1 Tax=Herbiconiux sp. SYSU D00978 TaxID=2812562 RepID=UPI001F6227D6|nr:ROK family protein [Herbiconiux sp. SYSU D00978]
MHAPMTTDATGQTLALAVDLGGTKVDAALVTSSGTVLPESRTRRPTGRSSSSDELVEAVRGVVAGALAVLPPGARFVGTGIGAAGPLRADAGLVSPLNLPVWRDFPLRQLVDDEVTAAVTSAPVVLAIDGLCIAIAEHWVGAARGHRDVLGMIVSTGIGGGLILGGVPVGGPTGNAGHIGHIEVGGFDERCLCGGTGCVEAVASGPKTVAWAQRQGFAGSTGEDLAAAYAAGDEIARAAVRRSGTAIGHAIASATSLVDLELVAIGGGFSHVSPDLFVFIRDAIAERAEFPFVTKTRVVPSALSGDGPIIGAGALVHHADVVP